MKTFIIWYTGSKADPVRHWLFIAKVKAETPEEAWQKGVVEPDFWQAHRPDLCGIQEWNEPT
jgi:hypothetical protein